MDQDGVAKNRPKILTGQTIRVRTPIGTLFVTLNENEEHHPFELFLNTGKSGSDMMLMLKRLEDSVRFYCVFHPRYRNLNGFSL